jgi:hypothetical protein
VGAAALGRGRARARGRRGPLGELARGGAAGDGIPTVEVWTTEGGPAVYAQWCAAISIDVLLAGAATLASLWPRLADPA